MTNDTIHTYWGGITNRYNVNYNGPSQFEKGQTVTHRRTKKSYRVVVDYLDGRVSVVNPAGRDGRAWQTVNRRDLRVAQ